MLSEQLKPEVHGVPIAGVGGPAGGGGAGGSDEHSPNRQLPTKQSVSVKHDADVSEDESSVDVSSVDWTGARTQPASNPRTRMVIRLMSGEPPECQKVSFVDSSSRGGLALRCA